MLRARLVAGVEIGARSHVDRDRIRHAVEIRAFTSGLAVVLQRLIVSVLQLPTTELPRGSAIVQVAHLIGTCDAVNSLLMGIPAPNW
jgi:hypothetical protein